MNETRTATKWHAIRGYKGADYEKVDLWLEVWASPMSFGWADRWCVHDAWRVGNEWFDAEGRLAARYITNWAEAGTGDDDSPPRKLGKRLDVWP